MMLQEDRLSRQFARAYFNIYPQGIKEQSLESLEECALFFSAHKSEVWFIDLAALEDTFKLTLILKVLEKFQLFDLKSLAALLIQKRKLHLFQQVLYYLKKEYLQRNGIIEFVVSSAHELDNHARKVIVQFLEKKTALKIKAEFKIEPSLIAGVSCTSDEYKWEFSLAQQIARLKAYKLDI